MDKFAKWRGREKGQTMVEYALVLLLIAVALLAAFEPLRTAVAAAFGKIAAEVSKYT